MNRIKMKNITKMYSNLKKDIIIDIQDNYHANDNENYYELLEQQKIHLSAIVEIKNGKLISEGKNLINKSAYERDLYLLDLYNNNNNAKLSHYFSQRRLM
jgi:hypothetical protein